VKNGTLQNFTTIVAAVFVAGSLWARIGSNANAMRSTLDEIRTEQREIAKQLQELLNRKQP
jgi:hypothetical protein